QTPTTAHRSYKRTQNGSASQLAIAEAERDAVRAHAVIAGVEAGMWKHKFNNKSQKKDSSKRLHTEARILTSTEGKEAAAETARKVQKKNAETERLKKRKEFETADILRRAQQQRDNSMFSDTIQSKTKPHLIDLAAALGLEYEGASVDVLRVRINAHSNESQNALEMKMMTQGPHIVVVLRHLVPRAVVSRLYLVLVHLHSYHPSIPPTSHRGLMFENPPQPLLSSRALPFKALNLTIFHPSHRQFPPLPPLPPPPFPGTQLSPPSSHSSNNFSFPSSSPNTHNYYIPPSSASTLAPPRPQPRLSPKPTELVSLIQ
ncbi:hypothetical protein BDP27DRAFT_1315159, partial [Rhodocollybia butyracea]